MGDFMLFAGYKDIICLKESIYIRWMNMAASRWDCDDAANGTLVNRTN